MDDNESSEQAGMSAEEALVFFKHLWPNDIDGYISLCKKGRGPGDQFSPAGFFPPDMMSMMVAETERLLPNFDVWASVCAYGGVPQGGRGKAEQIRWVPALWADVDSKSAPGVDLLAFLRGLKYVPTMVIATGNGYHAYWAFKQPFEITCPENAVWAREMNDRLRQWLNAEAGNGVSFDPVSDLARVMRVPGTFNYKGGGAKRVSTSWPPQWHYPAAEWFEDKLPALQGESRGSRAGGGFEKQGSLGEKESLAVMDRLVTKYVLRAGATGSLGRDRTGFDLAQQLNDHYVPKELAYAALVAYSREVPEYDTNGVHDPFTEKDGRAKVDSAYLNPPRGPVGMRTVKGPWLADSQHLSDAGNSVLFATQHAEAILYAEDSENWMAWDNRRWEPKAKLTALWLAHQTAQSLLRLAYEITDDDASKRAAKHAHQSLSVGRIKAIPDLARANPQLRVKAEAFDSDPSLLNTQSVTVNVTNGKSHEHRREDYCSMIAGVGYDTEAKCPQWKSWLAWASAGRADWVEHLQRAMGYALTGVTSEQVYWILYGEGANGKSTFLNVMEAIMGDYAWHGEVDLLCPKPGASTNGIADLEGKRMVTVVETREGQRIDERQIKMLTGGDTITARRLYCENRSFAPTHKFFFAMNHLPVVSDTSHAFWRRTLLVPWDATVAEGDKIDALDKMFVREEGPGILRWAVEGCLKWQQDGLQVPSYVRTQTQKYRKHEDVLGAFVDECLTQAENAWVSTADLGERYKRWCADELVKKPLGSTKLLGEIEHRLGVERGRFLVNGTRVAGYAGLGLKEDG